MFSTLFLNNRLRVVIGNEISSERKSVYVYVCVCVCVCVSVSVCVRVCECVCGIEIEKSVFFQKGLFFVEISM